MEKDFKSGFVTIIGKPNVGKSTFLNAVIGEKVAIVTPKPQTTRNCIAGIKNLPDAQIVFLDTPGIHDLCDSFNRRLINAALKSIEGVNIVLYMIDIARKDDDYFYDIHTLKSIEHETVFLLINKVDLVEKPVILELIERFSKVYPFSEIIPVSALKGINIAEVIDVIKRYLPPGPKYFPDDIYTDQPEKFIAAEIIREKAMLYLHYELPYSLGVVVDQMKEAEDGKIIIDATIVVERSSQKGIVIGHRGGMLKKIGIAAREELERIFATKVILKTWVKVRPKWKQSPSYLKEMRIV